MAKATVKNDWIGYLDRSYSQMKTSLLSRLGTSNPELSDHSESNPLITFISMFCGIGEMLNLYIDNMCEEAYLGTASRTSSVIKHSQTIDYRIRARAPELAEVRIDWSEPTPSLFIIPAGASIVSSRESLLFQTMGNVTIPAGVSISYLPMAQVESVTNSAIAVTSGAANQRINIGTTYMHRTVEVTIDGDAYTEVESFNSYLPTDKVFIVEIKEDGNAYIILGDNINGFIPTVALPISVTFFTTLGPTGKVGAGGFDNGTIDLGIALPGSLAIDDANTELITSGGSDYEDMESIRKNAPRSLRTLERMVTRQDHRDVMEMVAGVNKADISFNCGKKIYIYIAPDGGGIAGSLLLDRAQNRANETKMVGTFPVVRPAGETHLGLIITATAKRRKPIAATYAQIINALVEFGSIDNQNINGSIRLSDLYGLMDILPNVEYVDIIGMYTKPYARPINHTTPLEWTSQTTENSRLQVRWRIEFDGADMRVWKDGNYIESITIGSTYDDTVNSGFKFLINTGAYSSGQQWEFTTYPYLKNLTLDDFTVFSIVEADITLTVLPSPTTDI